VNHRQINVEEFLSVVKASEGKDLTTTVEQKPFTIEPWNGKGYRVHLQSGDHTTCKPEELIDCLTHWNETGSTITTQYYEYTRTISYFLSIVKVLDPGSFK